MACGKFRIGVHVGVQRAGVVEWEKIEGRKRWGRWWMKEVEEFEERGVGNRERRVEKITRVDIRK